MPADSAQGSTTAANGHGGATNGAAASSNGNGAAGGAGTAAAKRVSLLDKNVPLLSLPSQDLPAYYDTPSSDHDAASEDDLPSDAADFPGTTFLPLTNRGHKLSRLAPHTRRGKLGHHANVDGGFSDPLKTQSSLVPPAQKRRKLNDLAPAESSEGFPVAPNLHLVPRSLHTLSKDSDTPYPAFLPPAAQSPLDLLLSPAIQHTLGKKNQTFLNLAMSTTGLIEQESELVAALTGVCRGLRGEGFEWRWEGDEERKKEREEKAKEDEEERVKTSAAGKAQREKEREEKAVETAEREENEAKKADEAASEAQAVTEMEVEPQADGVKLEQETPVLQSAAAVPAPAKLVAVPGVEQSVPATNAESAVEAAVAAVPTTTDAGDVEMTDAASSSAVAPATNPSDGSATTSTVASEGLPGLPPLPSSSSAAPLLPTSTASDVPAIAITPAGPSPAASVAPDASSADAQHPLPTPAPPATNGDIESTPAATVGEWTAAAASNSTGSGIEASELQPPASAEATPAPLDSLSVGGGDSEDPSQSSTRRRSGRVATRGDRQAATGGTGGVVAGRHTRSRQSSPEEDYYSGDEDDEQLFDASGAPIDGEEGSGAARRGPRGSLVPEEPLPEYAARLVDPETFVRSRFVTEGGEGVEMERMAQGPQGGLVGTGQMERLTPNEQEVLLHDCLTDLHRFLADTLEYRNRLGEIRDGVLGVERRRKGMWRVLRTVASDWLAEEGAGAGFDGYEQ